MIFTLINILSYRILAQTLYYEREFAQTLYNNWTVIQTDILYDTTPLSNWMQINSNGNQVSFDSEYKCQNDQFSRYLGIIGYQQQTVYKEYSNLPPHSFIKIVVEVGIIHGQFYEGSFNIGFGHTFKTVLMSESGEDKSLLRFCNQTGSIKFFEFEQPHSSSTLNFSITPRFTHIIQGVLIRNLIIYQLMCHESCASCTSSYTCRTCPANAINMGNYCLCKEGYNLLGGVCYSGSCGGSYTTLTQIRQCVLGCPLNCQSCDSQTNECIVCSNQYQLRNGICVKTPTQNTRSLFEGFYNLEDFIQKNSEKFILDSQATQFYSIIDHKFALGGVGRMNGQTIKIAFFDLYPHYQMVISFITYLIDFSISPVSYRLQWDQKYYYNIGVQLAQTSIMNGPQPDTFITTMLMTFHNSSELFLMWNLTQNTYNNPFESAWAFEGCQSCTSYTSCSKCAEGFLWFNWNCVDCSTIANSQANCQCQNGYYRLHNQVECLLCGSYPIQSINLYAEAPCKCNNYYFHLNTTICYDQCPQNSYTYGHHECIACHSSCVTCQGQLQTDCLTCSSTYLIQYDLYPKGKCLKKCQFGYFNSNQVCLKCDDACSVCENNSKVCVTCNSGYYRNINGECKTSCDESYYINTFSSVCAKCHTDCKACNGPLNTNCTSCVNTRSLHLGGCVDSCPSKYVNLNNVCQPCTTNCDICTGPANNQCAKCSYGVFILANTCQQECPIGYYSNRLTYVCEICPLNCQICQGTQCLQCNQTYFLLDNTCTTCPIGYYGESGKCFKCKANCQSCLDGATCMSCGPEFLYYNSDCIAQCPQFTYSTGQSCSSCDSSCLTCNGSQSNNCLSCRSLYLQGTECVQNCQGSYFGDAQTQTCLQCHASCLFCFGSTQYQCLTCSNLFYMYQCVDECPPGYTQHGNVCDPDVPVQIVHCATQCESCSSVEINCTQCAANRVNAPTCGCPPQYYDVGLPQCQPCAHKCNLCSENGCINCRGNRIMEQNCNCPLGYYDDPNFDLCPKCPLSCSTCSTSTSCDTCLNNRIKEGEGCICEIGYYEAQEPYCLQCQPQCRVCSDFPEFCLECSGIRILPPICKCPEGYYDDLGSCERCDITCKTCSTKGCLLCAANRVGPVDGICSCPEGALSRTVAGSPYCQDCQIGIAEAFFSNDLSSIIITFSRSLFTFRKAYEKEYSKGNCGLFLSQETMDQLGEGYQCLIEGDLRIKLGYRSTIRQHDIIQVSNVGQEGCKAHFQQIFDATLQLPALQPSQLMPNVIFNKFQDTSVCLNLMIFFEKQINDGARPLSVKRWSLQLPANADQTLMQFISDNNQLNPVPDYLSLPPLILQYNVLYRFNVEFSNFIGLENQNSVDLIPQSSQSLVINMQAVEEELYRYQQIQVFATLAYYDCSGQQGREVEIQYSWGTEPVVIIPTSSNAYSKQLSLSFDPFTLNIGYHEVTLSAKLLGDESITTFKSIGLDIKTSDLRLSILGGNKMVGYTQNVTLNLSIIDLDESLQESEGQFEIYWFCTNLNDNEECLDQQDQVVKLEENLKSQVISAKTLSPYNTYIFVAQVYKDGMPSTTSCTVQVTEIDIPQLQVAVSHPQRLNYYEEQLLTFKYANTNPDTLMYAGAILYDQEVQATFTFQYLDLKFVLWNYFDSLRRGNDLITFRASFYDPRYLMPSIAQIRMEFNIPPQECSIQMEYGSRVIEFSTQVHIWVANCVDDQLPLRYRFMLYGNQGLLEEDLEKSTNLNYKLLQDYQLESEISMVLPYTGEEVSILGVSIQDQMNGVTNLTMGLSIQKNDQLSEYILNQYIESKGTLDTKLYAYNIVVDRLMNVDGMDDFKYQLFRQLMNILQNDLQTYQIDIVYQCLAQLCTLQSLQGYLVNNQELIDRVNENNERAYQNMKHYTQLQSQQLLNSQGNQQKEIFYRQFYRNAQILSSLLLSQVNYDLTTNVPLDLQQMAQNLQEVSIPNQPSHLFDTNSLSMDVRYVSEKILNDITGNVLEPEFSLKRLLQEDNQANFYKFSLVRYNQNPYYIEDSFPKNSTGKEVVDVQIVDVSTNKSPQLQQNISIQFPKKSVNETLSCISKNSQGNWTTEICRTEEEDDVVKCKCEKLSPTSVMNQIQNITETAKSLFTSETLESVLKYNYAETATFWVYVLQTVIYIIFVIWGYQQDVIQDIKEKNKKKSSKKEDQTSLKKINDKASEKKVELKQSTSIDHQEEEQNEIVIMCTEKHIIHHHDQLRDSSQSNDESIIVQGLLPKLFKHYLSKPRAFWLFLRYFHQILSIIYKYDPSQPRALRATITYVSIISSLSMMFLFEDIEALLFIVAFSIISAPINKIVQVILEKTLVHKYKCIRIIGTLLMISCAIFSSYVMLASLATFNSIDKSNQWTFNYEIAFLVDNLIYSNFQLFLQFLLHAKILKVSSLMYILKKLMDDESTEFLYGPQAEK